MIGWGIVGYRVVKVEEGRTLHDGRIQAEVEGCRVPQVFTPRVDLFPTEELALFVVGRDIDYQRQWFEEKAEEVQARIRDLRYERERGKVLGGAS